MEQIKLEIEKPYPKQIDFFKSRSRYTAYGGARRTEARAGLLELKLYFYASTIQEYKYYYLEEH